MRNMRTGSPPARWPNPALLHTASSRAALADDAMRAAEEVLLRGWPGLQLQPPSAAATELSTPAAQVPSGDPLTATLWVAAQSSVAIDLERHPPASQIGPSRLWHLAPCASWDTCNASPSTVPTTPCTPPPERNSSATTFITAALPAFAPALPPPLSPPPTSLSPPPRLLRHRESAHITTRGPRGLNDGRRDRSRLLHLYSSMCALLQRTAGQIVYLIEVQYT